MLAKAVELNPSDINFLVESGYQEAMNENFSKSIAAYNEANNLDSGNADAMIGL